MENSYYTENKDMAEDEYL